MPSLRLASICRVEVVNGGGGLRRVRFFSTEPTVKLPASTFALAALARASVLMSNWSSRLPSRCVSRAAKGAPVGVWNRPSTLQYSRARNASISASRSQISRSATDCTRPAERLPGSLRHSTGERVKPTR